jgi:glycosyltransferase involved in cell wall biosynthesis
MSYSVAIISSFVGKTPKGIAHSFVFDEAFRLAHRGIDVHIIRYKVDDDSYSYGIKYHGLEKKIDLRALKFFIGNLGVYPPISLLRKPTLIYHENLYALNTLRVVKKDNIDLIHAHFAYPEGFVGLLTSRSTRKPFIVTLHGYDVNVSKEHNYGIRLYPQYDFIVHKVLTNAAHIIVPSRLLYLRALEVGAKKSNISIIPPGVDPNIFKPNLNKNIFIEKYSLGDEPIILTVRGLKPIYNVYEVIKVAKIMPKSMKLKFVIIGDGELYPQLVKLAGDLINKRIYFLGSIPHTEIPYAMASASLLFDPCPIGQGINVLEAMACAKPVIAINTRGLWDYVIDGKTGFLVNSGDTQAIAEKIIYLLQNEEEAKRLGENGRKIIQEKFDINKRIEKIISLYEKLISN